MAEALLPCPFCGSRTERQAAATEGYIVAQCSGCDAKTNEVWQHDDDAKEKLAALWNRRADAKAISLGLLATLADKLARNRSKAISSLATAERKAKHRDLLELAGYQGDPDADVIECTALKDAYDDAYTMVQVLQDAVREHNAFAPNPHPEQ